MKATILAAVLAATVAVPVFPQSPSPTPQLAPVESETVIVEPERIPVPQEAPGGSSSPMGVSAGVGVGVVVLGIGLIIACGIACAQ